MIICGNLILQLCHDKNKISQSTNLLSLRAQYKVPMLLVYAHISGIASHASQIHAGFFKKGFHYGSMIMCLRGACSSCGKPQLAASDISLAVIEPGFM